MNNKVTFPVQIIFHNLEYSVALETKARKYAEKLGQYFDHIMSCHVAIEAHHRHHRGNIYHVRIDVVVPNAELVVNRDPAQDHAHEDAYVSLRDAFKAMTRQLQKYARIVHGKVKHHEPCLQGRILEIAPIADYGYIETINGRRIRFSSKSVVDYDFKKLEVGDVVQFVEAKSNDGTAASTVHVRYATVSIR